ncbi:MAG: hypothetical protein JXA99_05530 [Candidatus Lokiarchaeota archaeon]|nr:hypothetical protein [Candidatus Lokiarchaeota archaeon]
MENYYLFFIVLIFGITFFISDYYDHKHPILPISLIAGISVSYFFLVVLPEISKKIPEYPLGLEFLEYLFVLIGFSFMHVSEKFILQRVESNAQKKVRKLINMEKNLNTVEDNIENIINREIMNEKLDIEVLKDLGSVVTDLHNQGTSIKFQINQLKKKIHDHVNKNIEELRFFTNFLYHFLVGLILISLIFIELVDAILFYIFALFRIIISNRLIGKHTIFTDLDINFDYEETHSNKLILCSSPLIGIGIGFLVVIFFNVNLELMYILFSFISGVILYTIIREIIPEKEKGNPLFFLVGFIAFTILIIILSLSKVIVLINS